MIENKIVNNSVENSGLNRWAATRPVLPKKWERRFKKWLEKKYYAGMGWIKKDPEQRVNLKKRFPWCKSVIIVADNYYSRPLKDHDSPFVSIYAHGENYHKIVTSKLEKTVAGIKKHYPPIKHKIYVDTGPVLERAFAVEAGLGWMGKNNMLIIDELGSYCFLGILLLDKELESYGYPIQEKCGDCSLCIEACPTGALEQKYLHNSHKCLSYLTIEKKGSFTAKESNLIDNTLYGCDKCLEVCPWNKKWAKKALDKRYYSKKDYLKKTRQEWEHMDRQEFKDLFKNSVFKRLKYKRLKRNLAALDD